MRLFLASFRLDDPGGHLVSMLGDGRRTAIIANSMDPYGERGLDTELPACAELGLDATELDLRAYFGGSDRLAGDLSRFDLIWVRGGNVFALREAMARSGADRVIADLLRADAIVYGGYSAGPCVLSPTLRGLDLVDETAIVERMYGEPVRYDGLDVIDFAFVPHYDSPGHPETEAMHAVVEHHRREGIPYRTFRDGEILVIDGETETLVSS